MKLMLFNGFDFWNQVKEKFDDLYLDLTVREPTLPVAPATKMRFPSSSPSFVFVSVGCKPVVVAPCRNSRRLFR